jgi:hypothetical protein
LYRQKRQVQFILRKPTHEKIQQIEKLSQIIVKRTSYSERQGLGLSSDKTQMGRTSQQNPRADVQRREGFEELARVARFEPLCLIDNKGLVSLNFSKNTNLRNGTLIGSDDGMCSQRPLALTGRKELVFDNNLTRFRRPLGVPVISIPGRPELS